MPVTTICLQLTISNSNETDSWLSARAKAPSVPFRSFVQLFLTAMHDPKTLNSMPSAGQNYPFGGLPNFPAAYPVLLSGAAQSDTRMGQSVTVLTDSGEVFDSLPSSLPHFDEWLNYSTGININTTAQVCTSRQSRCHCTIVRQEVSMHCRRKPTYAKPEAKAQAYAEACFADRMLRICC